MILLFRIISDENPDFFRDLVIDESDTFLDFHQVIQKDLQYDPTQLASFFITSERWEKQQEITLIDMNQEEGKTIPTMGDVTIGEHVKGMNQRMIYVFDFFSERAFFMEVIDTSDETSPRLTPFIAAGKGDPPRQINLDLMDTGGPGPDPGALDDEDPGLFDDPGPDDEFGMDDLDQLSDDTED